MKIFLRVYVILLLTQISCFGQILFEDNFEGNLSGWEINDVNSIKIVDSQDIKQNKVLELTPNGNIAALIAAPNMAAELREWAATTG